MAYTPEEIQYGKGATRTFQEPGVVLRIQCDGRYPRIPELVETINMVVHDNLGREVHDALYDRVVDQTTFGTKEDGERMCKEIVKRAQPKCQCEVLREETISTE